MRVWGSELPVPRGIQERTPPGTQWGRWQEGKRWTEMAANSLPSAPDVCLIPSPQVWARGMPCLGWPSLFDTWQLPTHPLGAQGCHAVGGPGHTGGHRWVLQGTAPTDSRSTNPLTAHGWAWGCLKSLPL